MAAVEPAGASGGFPRCVAVPSEQVGQCGTGTTRGDDLPLCVFKVGGSLLDLPTLSSLLTQLRGQRPGYRAVWIAGGGPAADVVRHWDRVLSLGEETAHQLALESLRLTAALLQRVIGPAVRVTNFADFARVTGAGGAEIWPVLICADALAELESDRGLALPHTWQVTTDSIAAWIALHWQAVELVLVKSIAVPAGNSVEQAAAEGLVDQHFPQLAARVPRVSWVYGRQPAPSIQSWLHAGQPMRS